MEKPTCVYRASGEVDAQQVRDFLEANGIACSFQGESLRKTHGLTIDGLGLVEIHVQAVDAPRARKLLAAADKGDFSLDEDELVE